MRKDKVSVKNVRTTNVRTGEVKESRIQTTTPDERPNIWNLQAFVIVFLFIMLGTTINVYSVNNDNLTWVDSNGDFKLDSYNHSMINLDTDLVELNNQSLNDVFLDGNLITNHDFSNGSTGWILYNSSVINNQCYIENTIGNNSYCLQYVFNLSDIYFVYVEHNVIQNTIFYATTGRDAYGVNSQTYHTFKGTPIQSYFVVGRETSSAISKAYVDYVYAINLTVLGLTSLSENDLKQYYDLYVSLQENRIESYKELGNEPISQWQNLTQHLQLVIDAIMGPIDNISDWINKFMNGLFS